MERKYAWHNYDDATMEKVYALSDTYRQFLDNGKTERECVTQIIKEAQEAGYECLEEKAAKGEKLKAVRQLKLVIRFITHIWINLLLYLILVLMILNWV